MTDDVGAAGAAGGGGGPRGPGMRNRGGKAEDKERMPVTKLGRLVKDMKIKSLEEIYLFSLPIKESEIIDFFLGVPLKDEVLKIMPVQKQARAGQCTRFKAFVAIEDYNGHVGLGVKCSKKVATAIRGAITLAKLSPLSPCAEATGGTRLASPTPSLQGDQLLWLCAGASSPCPGTLAWSQHLCPRSCS
uniref:S5 DRBM domain-containing protein n=1 Tax=Cebus imitator TaxID=2715852 RepID=A0A2K5QWF7_CEBIM